MRIIGLCAAVGVVLLALGCSSSLTVKDDFDPDIEFDRYYTWYWLADTPTTEAVEGADKSVRDIDALVRSLIDAEMSKKGLTTVETNPDIWVNYHIGMKGEFGGVNFDRDYLQQIQNAEVYKSSGGVFVIDVIDARTGRLAWRGTGTGAVNVDPTPEMVRNNVTRAVKKIMDKFPPK